MSSPSLHRFQRILILALPGLIALPGRALPAFRYPLFQTYRHHALSSCLLPFDRGSWIPLSMGSDAPVMNGYAVSASLGNLYGIPELMPLAAHLTAPVGAGRWGMGLGHLGFDLCREYRLWSGLTLPRPDPFVSTVVVEADVVAIRGYPVEGTLLGRAEISFIASGWAGFSLAVSGFNMPFLHSRSGEGNVEIVSGLALRAVEDLTLYLTWARGEYRGGSIRMAVEARLSPTLAFRMGTTTNPEEVVGGFAFHRGSIVIDVFWSYHPLLGPSTGLTVTCGRSHVP